MPFEFRPAKLEGVGVFIALAGASSTGKTYTALRLARGMAGPKGKIAAIDTEGKRMSHYSKEFNFDVYNMRSPFHPLQFAEAVKGAEKEGYAACVIDSYTLEWSGLGGVLSLYDDYMRSKKYAENFKNIAWATAKAPHKLMINDLIQCTMPIIFCLRANPVAKHLANDVEGRWKVDQDKRFMYEWTVSLTLHPDTPGKPRFDMFDAGGKPLFKVQEQHRHMFPEGKLIGEDAGAALEAWRNSGVARSMGSGAVEPTHADDDQDDPPDPSDIKIEGALDPASPAGKARSGADRLLARIAEATTEDTLHAIAGDVNIMRGRDIIKRDLPQADEEIAQALTARFGELKRDAA